MLNTEELNFDNLEPVNPEELDSMFTLDFGDFTNADKDDANVKKSKPESKPKPKPELKLTDKTNTDEPDSSDEEDSDEDILKSSLDLNPEPEEEAQTGVDYLDIINLLTDKGIIIESYDGFDPEADATEEVLLNLLEHNLAKRDTLVLDEFFEGLTDYTKRLILYDINAKGEDVDTFIKSLVEEQNIKNLSIENEFDQEKIVRQWYRNKEDFTAEEINEKITELKESGLLEKEAKRLKPKLDDESESIARRIEEEKAALRKLEQSAKEQYHKRVVDFLSQGKIGNITLSKDELTQLYTFMSNDEHEVTMPGNKKVMMSPLEAVIMFNKYNTKGSIENLALATLLLVNPNKFDEYYRKKATTEVTDEFTKNYKYRISGSQQEATPARKSPKIEPKSSKWKLNLR